MKRDFLFQWPCRREYVILPEDRDPRIALRTGGEKMIGRWTPSGEKNPTRKFIGYRTLWVGHTYPLSSLSTVRSLFLLLATPIENEVSRNHSSSLVFGFGLLPSLCVAILWNGVGYGSQALYQWKLEA